MGVPAVVDPSLHLLIPIKYKPSFDFNPGRVFRYVWAIQRGALNNIRLYEYIEKVFVRLVNKDILASHWSLVRKHIFMNLAWVNEVDQCRH